MFTPQRKGLIGWSPLSATRASGKGKGVADGPPPPPPIASIGVNGSPGGGDEEDTEPWRRFREAGLLDIESIKRKDKEALVLRISELEKELHEYQYNMGLLLIEKNDWAAKYDDMRKAISESQEILKREQSSHINAMCELNRREENMRLALGVEKQCVADLEKALHELRSELADVKVSSNKKISDVHSLEASLEEKLSEADAKRHSADAKIAEANRKLAQVDRKSEDLEARERKLEKAKQSFDTECQSKEKHLIEQREYLRDWDAELRERESKLAESQKLVNDQEERINSKDRMLRKQQLELEEAKKICDNVKATLESRELDIVSRTENLLLKEKDYESRLANLEMVENKLLEKEEKLNTRDAIGLQKLLDDHREALQAKTRDLDFELEKKRIQFNDELKLQEDALEKRIKENNLREKQLQTNEEVLDSKKKKFEAKEQDLEMKSKALRKWEESVKDKEDKLLVDQRKIVTEMQQLSDIRIELEGVKKAIDAEKNEIMSEKENLEITKEEREQHILLMSQLKQQSEDYNMRIKLLAQESEHVKQQKVEFEKEWDALDEKRASIEAQLKQFHDERERFERMRVSDEKKLNSLKLDVEAENLRKIEELECREATFREEQQHARAQIDELIRRERADMARELESHKHELEMDMAKKLSQREEDLQQLRTELSQKIVSENSRIENAIKESESKIQKIKVEAEELMKEKAVLLDDRKKLVIERAEIASDIEKLRILSKSLKDRREKFIKDRDRFLQLVEQCKVCSRCNEPVIDDLDLLDLQNTENIDIPNPASESPSNLPSLQRSPQGSLSIVNSFGLRDFMRGCTRLFRVSPGKGGRDPSSSQKDMPITFAERLDDGVPEQAAHQEPTAAPDAAEDSFDAPHIPSNSMSKENIESGRHTDEQEFSFGVADNSGDIQRLQSDDCTLDSACGRIGKDDTMDLPDSTSLPDNQLKPKSRGRSRTIKRTRSVKAVVEDAKTILGEMSEDVEDGTNVNAMLYPAIPEESQEDSVAASAGQKRRFAHLTSEQDTENSEAHSERASLGVQRRKRRQTAVSVPQNSGEKRYNLRKTTVKGKAAAQKTKGRRSAGQPSMVDGNSMVEGISASDMKENVLVQNTVKESVIAEEKEPFQMLSNAPAESSNNELEVEEVPEVAAAEEEVEPATPSGSGLAGQDEEGDEDEEEDEKNRSIGKKLWTFFTT